MMERTRNLNDRIDELQQELSAMEDVYEQAKRRHTGQDQDWEMRKAMLIRQMCDLIVKFQIGDDSTKAVAIVAQCGVMATELKMPEHWVTKYEEKKQMLGMARTQQARQEELMEKARLAAEDHPWRRASNL